MTEEEGGATSGDGAVPAATAATAATATNTTVHVGLHGTAPVFDSTQEEWEDYAERLDSYFLANDIGDPAKKRAILVNAVGPKTYRLIKTLCLPEKPQDHSFEEIVKRVKAHFHPKPSPIIKRYEFNERKQKPGESIAEFLAAIRKITDDCEYGTVLDDMLRDRLVFGVADRRLQNRFLRETTLTYVSARDMALAAEAADKDSKRLRDGVDGNDSSPTLPTPSSNPEGTTVAHVDKQSRKPRSRKPTPSDESRNASSSLCYRCGGKHEPSKCRYKDYECRYCHKKGHLAVACRKKAKDKASEQTHRVDASLSSDEEYTMYTIRNRTTKPFEVKLELNGVGTPMEVDTGASVSIVSEDRFKMLQEKGTTLRPSRAKLFTYTGEAINVVGVTDVTVKHNGQSVTLPLIVTGGTGPSLLGRDWLAALKLDWKEIFVVHAQRSLQDVLDAHKEVFAEGLGTVKGVTAAIHVDPTAPPQFHKARPLPYTLQKKVERELERLESQGVIEPVQFSDWAAPVVPVIKGDGSVRLCGDYKVTVNKAAKQDRYPIPRIEDLFSSLSGGKEFSKLDLSHAYQQVQLDEASRQYVTINTHKGLFCYNRLPFGISSAPSIFQRIMDTLLQGIDGVSVYIDDILVTGKTTQEHLEHLEEVLKRLENAGMRLKKSKCAYLLPSVEYLGHDITRDGLRTADSKVEAIVRAPAPKNVTELRSFLGLVNYYGKFLQNLATTLSPLYSLLQKNKRWSWGQSQTEAFDAVKKLLLSSRVLVHFDDSLPLVLSCDASPYGIGAVLSHIMPNGDERPVSFASRTLTETEKKYAQLEKEALAIVYGVRKFHQYLYGRKFELRTDHKPLVYIFNPGKPISAMASGRIQRWALTLGAHQYTIKFQKGTENCTADAVSRLPLPETRTEPPKPAEVVYLMEYLDTSPVTSSQIRRWTEKDSVLAKIKHWMLSGWPKETPEDETLRPFFHRKCELSMENGCLLWGSRVVVPEKGKEKVLKMLHQSHPGMSKMKSLARCYVWWPRMDREIEACVKACEMCQVNQKAPPVVPLHPWSYPSRPWSRIHIDHAGPFMGKTFLLVIDAYTKWLDVHITPSTSSSATIELLRKLFSTFGLPEVVVSDNGTGFKSEEFEAFLRANGVKHVCTPPYHPSSNGLVERAVQTLKGGLKKLQDGSLETKLSRFLFSYRSMPHGSTGLSPAELMFGRRLHSPLDNIRPNHERKVHNEQERQKSIHDRRAKIREFSVGDLVYARNYGAGAKWLPGQVRGTLGSAMFEVILTDGREIRRHADQLRSRAPAVTVTQEVDGNANDDDYFDIEIPNPTENTETVTGAMASEQTDDSLTPAESETPRVDESNDRNESGAPRAPSEDSPHSSSEGATAESNTNTDPPNVEPNTSTEQTNIRRSNRARNPPAYYSHSGVIT